MTGVAKADKELRIVWAEVYAPNRPDSDGEYMDEEGIRKMAYDFMRNMRLDRIDQNHDNETVPGATVVESFIARKGDPDFIEGAWVVGVHVPDDETWDKIQSGEINGFSIEANVVKEPKEVILDLPPVITGKTMKAEGKDYEDDHTHTFYVAYDGEGRFIGGRTDEAKGHIHLIKRGTVTEETLGHKHRFSHIDDVLIQEPACN